MKSPDVLWPAGLTVVVALLFVFGAPADNAFYWADSPRHALNGVFVMDLIRDMPLSDPKGWAYDYYAQYPALTVLFYPPFFYFLLAPFFALLGVSHETALFVMFLTHAALGLGTYKIARLWMLPAMSFAVALMMVAMPEIAFWGRQVMLEIPCFALMVWSAYCLLKHLRTRHVGYLYASAALLVLAAYTKLVVVFLALPILVALFMMRGWEVFRDRHSYIIGTLAVVGVIPLAAMTLLFGQGNINSVVGINEAVQRTWFEELTWYAFQFPGQLGWGVSAAVVIFVIAALARRGTVPVSRAEGMFLILWLVAGYAFFAAIGLKEARFSLVLLLPLVIWAGFAFTRLLPPGIASVCAIGIGLFTLFETSVGHQVFYVAGYKDVVDYVAERAPKNSNVLFSGYRDGSFIFGMRTREDRRDIGVVRSDKLLVRVAIGREYYSATEKEHTEDEIAQMIDQHAIHYVVAQPGFWTDLGQMQRFESVLASHQFEEVARFETPSNYGAHEKELVVYRNRSSGIVEGPVAFSMELPIVDMTVSGEATDVSK